jgi:hypothetical protein
MLALSDPLSIPNWNDSLPVLKADDVRGLSDALIGESEGTRRPSWIWTTNTGVLASGADKAGHEGTYLLILQGLFFGANYYIKKSTKG